MEKDLLIWIFSGMFICVAGGLTAYLTMIGKVNEMAEKFANQVLGVDKRLLRVETLFEMWGEKAAKFLHSPHTPKLDALLEKYYDKHYNLTPEEWTELYDMCREIEENTELPREERSLAGFISMMCAPQIKAEVLPPKKHV